MQPLTDPPGMSSADAAARLRYVSAVRTRARRAGLAPAFALTALGAIVAAHGLLRTVSPRNAVLTIAWITVLLVVRVGVGWQRRRAQRNRGVVGPMRLRVACGVAGALAAVLAVAVGGDPLVSAVVASAAVAAYVAGMPVIAAVTIVAGALGNAIFLGSVAFATDEVLVGTGLLAAGLACQALERRGA
jgi:hypothetical protein